MEMHSPLEEAGRNLKFEPSIDLLFLLGVDKSYESCTLMREDVNVMVDHPYACL